MLTMLPIQSIIPADDNLRRRIGDVRDLAASITAVGIVEPLLVTPADGKYVIVAGHRRHAAAQKAGLVEVPCTVRELTDAERVEIMLVENLQRSDLSPIEEASGYFRLVEFGLTQRELAGRIGRSARHVTARLALLELPKAAQRELQSGALTVAEGNALLALRDHPEIIERLLADEWSRTDIERAVVREQQRLDAATVVNNRSRDDADDEDEAHDAGREGRRGERPDPYAEQRAKAKVRAVESNARIEFARALVTRKVPKTDALALVAAQVLGDLSATHAKFTARILGLDAVEGTWGPDYRAAIEQHAGSSAAERDRVLLTAALAIGEDSARHSPDSPAARRHVEFLAAYGFEANTNTP